MSAADITKSSLLDSFPSVILWDIDEGGLPGRCEACVAGSGVEVHSEKGVIRDVRIRSERSKVIRKLAQRLRFCVISSLVNIVGCNCSQFFKKGNLNKK